jgi:hypothetical protein
MAADVGAASHSTYVDEDAVYTPVDVPHLRVDDTACPFGVIVTGTVALVTPTDSDPVLAPGFVAVP